MLGLAIGWAAALAAAVWCALLLARLERIARATHELRAPLCAARLGLHAAGRGGAAEPLERVDGELERAALALADLEAARAGRRLCARREAVAAVELLERVRGSWSPLAWPTGRGLRVEAPSPGTIAPVAGDASRLAQALGTLVANALEHGEGEVVLSARSWAGRVRLEVADEGAGPARSLRRLARGRWGGRGARGRGLAIAARIARDHGGRLMREPGGGCRMVLELPARVAPATSARRELRGAVAAASLDPVLGGGLWLGGAPRPGTRR